MTTLTKAALAAMLSVVPATIDRMEAADPAFPRRRQLSRARVFWLSEEVDEYLRTRPVGRLTSRTAAARLAPRKRRATRRSK